METPFTNVHTHVFNTDCAPERFFRVLSMGWGNAFAGMLKQLLDSRKGRSFVHFLYMLSRDTATQRKWARYVSFMQVGSKISQREIFEQALAVGKQYDPSIRLIGLTVNMDWMDSTQDIKKSFETQLEEVRDVKRYYPDHFFPFLGVDPYHKSGKELKEWVQANMESGFLKGGVPYPYFYGIKLYPAHGFFPFDRRLEAVYAYAEEYDIPIMTHCTRSGSMYIGDNIQERILKKPSMIMPAGNTGVDAVRNRILGRIEAFYAQGLVQNNAYGNNGAACDLFSHPENFIPVLEAFPRLKVCLAHMGGTTEFIDTAQVKSEEVTLLRRLEGGQKWLDVIHQMMERYPNLYTDVSYTLSEIHKPEIQKIFLDFLGDPNDADAVGKRVLFGTDFFMTEQEKKEMDLYATFLGIEPLHPWLDYLTKGNPATYLSNILSLPPYSDQQPR